MSFGDFSLDLTSLDAEGKKPDPNTVYDLVIAGGGPAAMTAALYAARKSLNLALLTYDFGGQVGVTSWVDNYMGFQTITGEELVSKFVEQVKQFDLPVLLGEKVLRVEQDGEIYKAIMDGGAIYQGRTFILATGKRDRMLGVPGEKENVGKGVAYCATCDAPFYKDKKVVVAGGGNSAFTAALDLLNHTPDVTLVNLVEGWQADPIIYDAVVKSDTVKLLDKTQVVRINGEKGVESVDIEDLRTGKKSTISTHGIFVEIGLLPNSEPVEGFVELNANKEVVVDCTCKTSRPGFFGAGDVTTVPYKQIVISAGEGSKAALAAYDNLISRGLL
jgi:alkyl hydroperoxide reductase subunit F